MNQTRTGRITVLPLRTRLLAILLLPFTIESGPLRGAAIGALSGMILAMIGVLRFTLALVGAAVSGGVPRVIAASVESMTFAGDLLVYVLGFALSGLVYGIAAPPLRRVPGIGHYLAGIVGAFPAMLVLGRILTHEDDQVAWLAAPGRDELAISGFMALIYGAFLGHATREAAAPSA